MFWASLAHHQEFRKPCAAWCHIQLSLILSFCLSHAVSVQGFGGPSNTPHVLGITRPSSGVQKTVCGLVSFNYTWFCLSVCQVLHLCRVDPKPCTDIACDKQKERIKDNWIRHQAAHGFLNSWWWASDVRNVRSVTVNKDHKQLHLVGYLYDHQI